MALVKLMQENILKFMISQNCDGLHRKSGIPPEKISELHGNSNAEKCVKCKKSYMRDFSTCDNSQDYTHYTGRLCDNPSCRGQLKDRIINFGENLELDILEKAMINSSQADLILCLGSSLTVSPANQLPQEVLKKGGKMVIVNLQKTPLDAKVSLRINGLCDQVMEKLMKQLDLQIPWVRFQRRLMILKQKIQSGQSKLLFQGIDVDNQIYSLFPAIEIFIGTEKHQQLQKQPFEVILEEVPNICEIILYFQGYYQELPLRFISFLNEFENQRVYQMDYDPYEGLWESIKIISES